MIKNHKRQFTLGLMGLIRTPPDWARLLDEGWADRLQALESAQP